MTARFKPKTPCIDCAEPCYGTRCRRCHRAQLPPPRGRRPGLSGDWKERQRRKAAVDSHIAEHGMICPGYGVPAHNAVKLTADHVIPVAQGGAENGDLSILCTSCNAAKRDGRPPARRPQRKAATGPARPAVRAAEPRSHPPAGEPVHQPPAKEVAVPNTTPPAQPPVPLAESGRRLWDSVVSRYDLEEHESRLLVEACRTVDLLDTLAGIIAAEGLMVPVLPHGTKVNPAAIEARQQKIALARLTAALRLPAGEDTDDDGELRRPQRRVGVRGVYAIRGGAS